MYADLEAKAAEATAAFDEAAASLKTAEKKLSDMSVLIKHITTYQETKRIASALKTAKNKDAYKRGHESALILHEAAARALKTAYPGGGKLPPLAALKAEHAKLAKRKAALQSEYAGLKRQAREYGIIKKNVDVILNPKEQRGKAKERGMEL
jgi:hypothetical protein